MGRYLVRRLLLSFLSLFGLVIATFILLRFLPGGPFDDETRLAPQVLESLKSQYGLDLPLPRQLFLYINNLLHLNFGSSILYAGKSVNEVIAYALPRSFSLGGITLIVSILFGFAFGLLIFSVKSKAILQSIHFMFLSTPTLFLGPLLILIFGIWLDILPITIDGSFTSFVLPIAVLSVRPIANIARLLVGALEESMSQPWVMTARAGGIQKNIILLKYALKLSLIPLLSYLGLATAGILSGSLLVEMIFNVQGLGTQFIDGLISRDYSLIIALTLLYGLLLMGATLIFDMLMYALDPRMEKF